MKNQALFAAGILWTVIGGIPVHCQQPSNGSPITPAIRVTTRLVAVDVVATGKDGKPINDLKAQDFTVEENGKKQRLSLFNAEADPGTASRRSIGQLPPNVYTNRPEYHLPNGPLTILVIDGLNTSYSDQAYARQQLINYASSQLKPGQDVAVYALGNQLFKLQDFTSEPGTLRLALESYKPASLSQHGSTLAPNQGSTVFSAGGGTARPISIAAAQTVALKNVQQFETEQAVSVLQARIAITLASLRAIARQVDGRLGRKKLVWVTTGFPVSMVPETNEMTYVNTRVNDPTAPAPLPTEQTYDSFSQLPLQQSAQEIRRTSTLLSDAQIAVYPVDARGLLGAGVADASHKGTSASGLLVEGQEFGQSISAGNSRVESSQVSMHDLAEQTGGRVFLNRNDIDNAVLLATSDGASYYSCDCATGPDTLPSIREKSIRRMWKRIS